MSLAKAIKTFSGRALEDTEQVVKGSAEELFSETIMRTPVGNVDLWEIPESEKERIKRSGYKGGRLRKNWNASVDSEDRSNDKEIDPSGKETISRMERVVRGSRLGQTLYLTNTTPYGMIIEAGRKGHGQGSKQAPKGMLGVTAAGARGVVRRKVRET